MEFTGRVTHVLDKSGISKKNEPFIAWQYRIEEMEGQYPQSLCADVFGDKVEKLSEGDVVTVTCNVKCDEYQGKLYGKNNVWKVKILTRGVGGMAPEGTAGSGESGTYTAPVDPFAKPADDGSDLPF